MKHLLVKLLLLLLFHLLQLRLILKFNAIINNYYILNGTSTNNRNQLPKQQEQPTYTTYHCKTKTKTTFNEQSAFYIKQPSFHEQQQQ
jgi:hypothetical protein